MKVSWPWFTYSLLTSALLCPLSVAQSPSAAQHEQQAQEYLRARQPELARKEFEAVVASDPNDVNAQANLGVLLYFAGDFKEAEPHLRTALLLGANQAKLRALLGFSERRNGELERARADLAAALPQLEEPKVRKQAGLELVELDTAAGDLPAAATVLSQLKASMPTDSEVLYAAYRTYTDLAGEAMLDLSLGAPDSAQMHQAIAHELLRERDNAGAIANMRAALKADPTLPGGHFELAEMLHASTEAAAKAEAEQQYKLALEANPRDSKTLSALGDLASEKGDHAAAVGFYQQALASQPENADASLGLAHELVETGHAEEAQRLLEGVLKSDPSNMLAHYRLSAVYRRLHRPEDAKREVAEYERLKALKEKLRAVYGTMHLNAPPNANVP